MVEARVLLVGARGHGRTHLADLRRLATLTDGRVRLVGVCDLAPLDDTLRALAGPVPVSDCLADLLRQLTPDITLVCTPIHTHADLAVEAMTAGSHVLVEKPPAASRAAYDRMVAASRSTGRVCAVNFQDLASDALPAVRRMLARGDLGELRGIGVTGTWVRDSAYYARTSWAGHRSLDGVPVVDGSLTNPFAHAVALALHIAGAGDADDLASVETELYHAHPIEADDTASVRVTTSRGLVLGFATTLCAERSREPAVRVYGSRGELTLWYKEHRLRRVVDGQPTQLRFGHTEPVVDLARHLRDPARPLAAPLAGMGAFTAVLEAIRTAPAPLPIGGRHQRVERRDGRVRRVVPGVDAAVAAAAREQRLFSELGVPWSRPRG